MILIEDGKILWQVEEDDINPDGSCNIPDTVTTILDSAFFFYENLKKIKIPEFVNLIGYRAFESCTNLEEIILPDGLTSINPFTFADCTSLTKVSIPNSVIKIGSKAFENCTNLKIINLPPNIKSISQKAFLGCQSLEGIIINSEDMEERKRIIELLPANLRPRVLIYSPEQLDNLWNRQLNKITCPLETNPLYRFFSIKAEENDPLLSQELFAHMNNFVGNRNPWYIKAKALMINLPLPTREEDRPGYEKEIGNIVESCIQETGMLNSVDNSPHILKF